MSAITFARSGARLAPWLLLSLLAACTDGTDDVVDDTDADTDVADTDTDADDTDDTDVQDDLPTTYEFASRFGAGSSVAYDGQVFRQLLIVDLGRYLGGLTGRLNGGYFPEAGDVARDLDFYFSFDATTSGSLEFSFSPTPPALQSTYDDVSRNKKLVDKIAGNDPVGQHKDWAVSFVGWAETGVTTPESLVRRWFDQIDAAAVAWSNGTIPSGPNGPVPNVYVTADGLDLQQLLLKFLGVAVSFSQGVDDYLDDDLDGKGILSDNSGPESEGKAWTALEHQWDEGFGYFGAARDYGAWTDAEIASPGTRDADTDGRIDLLTEVSWGHSGNAAKRDLGSAAAAPTDFTRDAWEGFVRGRQLIADTEGNLSPAKLAELQRWRDQAVEAWEKAIAATVVHYVNDVLQDMGKFGTEAYSFGDHAKHWSEMKGFALGFQFNRQSPLSDGDFQTLHDLLGQAPVLSNAGATAIAAYRDDLRAARALIGAAYDFDEANLGDDDGQNGW